MFSKKIAHRVARALFMLAAVSFLGFGSTSAMAEDSFTSKLLDRAMNLVGVKYRFGGTSPASGLDCSGYVQYVFQNAVGVALPRVASAQSRVGEKISNPSDMRPGDMVFFNTRGFAYSHVGIYVGNGMFIHSPRSGASVRVESMEIPYWKSKFNGARRVHGYSNNVNSIRGNVPMGM